MRGETKFIRGLGVSAVALLLIVGGVTAANSGASQSRVEPAGTAEATETAEQKRREIIQIIKGQTATPAPK